MILDLYVQPGAKKTEIVGVYNGKLKIRLATSPIEGRANKELLKYVAQIFKVAPSQVILKRGDKSRHKVLWIMGTLVDPDFLVDV